MRPRAFSPYLILLPILLSPSLARGDECTEVRLDVPGGTMEGVRVQNQAVLGTCQSESFAQYLSALSRKNGNPVSVDRIALAFNSATLPKNESDQNLNGIHLEDQVLLASTRGVCTEEKVKEVMKQIKIKESDLRDLVDQISINREEIIGRYQEEVDGAKKQLQKIKAGRPVNDPRATVDTDSGLLRKQEILLTQQLRLAPKDYYLQAQHDIHCKNSQLFALGSFSVFLTHTTKLLEPLANYLIKILPNLCSEASRVKFPFQGKVTRYTNTGEILWKTYQGDLGSSWGYIGSNPNDLRTRLNQTLKKKTDLPALISYCSNIFYDPEGPHRKYTKYEDCGHHAGLIIGRRRNPITGSCQLLVRNSWGTDQIPAGRGVKSECYYVAGKAKAEDLTDEELNKAGSPARQRFSSIASKGRLTCTGNHWVDEQPFLQNSLQTLDVIR